MAARGWAQGRNLTTKGHQELWGDENVLHLIVVVITQVYTFVKIHWTLNKRELYHMQIKKANFFESLLNFSI